MNKNFSLLAVLALIAAVAMGQSSLKDTKTQLAASADVIPVGTVMAYVGASAPTGWLLAQGQCVSQTTYAALYAVTSALPYQTGCGGGLFKLPPMNGRYLRGAGAPTDGQGGDTVAVGTFAAGKTKANGLGTSIPSASHTHNMSHYHQWGYTPNAGTIDPLYSRSDSSAGWTKDSGPYTTADVNAMVMGGAANVLASGAVRHQYYTVTTGKFFTTGALSNTTTLSPNTSGPSGVLTASAGDTETRPTSYAVNFIIKY